MIKDFLEAMINELGATGLLVVGLYWILYQPLRTIARHMENVNSELAQIRDCLIETGKKINDEN